MFDGRIPHHDPHQDGEGQYCCEFERTLKGEYCGKKSEVRLDGLRLCERHANRLHLDERVAYWRAILAHIKLWSGEARTRGREDVVGLLEIERTRAATALERAYAALQRSQDGSSRNGKVSRDGEDGSGDGRVTPPWWPPLLLLSIAVAG
jgi:hypothetical protein